MRGVFLHVLPHIITTAAPWGKQCDPSFANKEAEAREDSGLLMATQPVEKMEESCMNPSIFAWTKGSMALPFADVKNLDWRISFGGTQKFILGVLGGAFCEISK